MKKWLLILPFLIAGHVHAEVNPTYGNDKRIQYFKYTPNDVFVINAKVGYSSLIQFEDDEIIHDDGALGMGNANAWSLGVKGNNIIFKPVQEMPDTNMIVVTNKRTYAFELNTDKHNTTYVARFNYPKDKIVSSDKNESKNLKLRALDIKDSKNDKAVFIDSRINTHYFMRGHREIAPTSVWDNNLFTYLKYDNANDLPAIYKVLPDGTEALVNTHIEDNILVVHEVSNTLRLRLGKSVLDLQNANKQPTTFNVAGTSEDDLIRTVK